MKNKRRTEITLETHEELIIRHRSRTAFCEFCRTEVRMLPPDVAAAWLQSTARVIFRRVEAGELHFSETPSGSLLLCGNSLAAWKQK